jgi:hypothetical protein
MCTLWKPGKQYISLEMYGSRIEKTHSWGAKRNSIYARSPPGKDSVLPQSPGTPLNVLVTSLHPWLSIHRSGFHSFALELQSSTERFTTKIGIRNISPRVIDWYALHQHTISVHERFVERDDVVFDSCTVRATNRNAGWMFDDSKLATIRSSFS